MLDWEFGFGSFENAKKLHDLLGDNAEDTFVHCGSGNRVGALMALRAYEYEGASLEEAIEIGKSAGMTRLEGEVRSQLDAAEQEK